MTEGKWEQRERKQEGGGNKTKQNENKMYLNVIILLIFHMVNNIDVPSKKDLNLFEDY